MSRAVQTALITVLALVMIAAGVALVRSWGSQGELERQNKALADQLEKYHRQASQDAADQAAAIGRLQADVKTAKSAAGVAMLRVGTMQKRLEEILEKQAQNDADIDALLAADLPERLHEAAERYRQSHKPK